MAKLHLRATINAAPSNHLADFRPLPKAWREKYSSEFLNLANDLLARFNYGIVLWKIEHEHPTIWADRYNVPAPPVAPPVPAPRPPAPTQPSLGLEEPDDPIRPDVPKPLRVRRR